jgi:hypothetical protein
VVMQYLRTRQRKPGPSWFHRSLTRTCNELSDVDSDHSYAAGTPNVKELAEFSKVIGCPDGV